MTATLSAAPDILDIYDAALRRAETGEAAELILRDAYGTERTIDAAAWCRPRLPGDTGLLRRCAGPTLDIGCGPGRLLVALSRWGLPALGIDVSATAVRLARSRGAVALRRNVFGPLPGHGRWKHMLLADGNIGIGGDPAALLRRCRELLARDGRLHAEVAGPGTRTWSGEATVFAKGSVGRAGFLWAEVAADDLATVADQAALQVIETWQEEGRWFATLTPA